jgi:glycosyltransferase involved in cell wall biosynthesis
VPQINPSVVYWNNIPAPYMLPRFEALAARGNLNFEAWFNQADEAGRPAWEVAPETWGFRHRYLPALRLGGLRLNLPLPLLAPTAPDLLVSLYSEPAFLLGWSLARQRGVRTAFWVEVTHDHITRRYRYKEQMKQRLFRRVDGILTVGQDGVAWTRKYGTPEQRIFPIGHSFDLSHFQAGAESARAGREALRRQLGLCGTVFLYVGRFIWLKGLSHLLDAFAVLQRRLGMEEHTSLLLVGEGPEERRLRAQARDLGLRNIVFEPFKQQAELPRYYAAADAFVFPTLGDTYGLVVDEAMAASLPVISTSSAGEIRERIEEGVNGYVVPRENSAALLERMELLARDPCLRARLGAPSPAKIARYSPERWAERFEYAVDRMLAMPRPGTETR